jgi:hypothetical protein
LGNPASAGFVVAEDANSHHGSDGMRFKTGGVGRRIVAALSVLLPLLSACGQTNLRELEMSYLRAAVSEDLLPYASIEIPAIENITRTSDAQGPYLGLRTFRGQAKKNGGVRAEISIDYPYRDGDTVRYSWRMKLPGDFPSDAANRWWLVAQWHDQPDRTRGQTWDGYPGHSPPVALGYGRPDGQDQLAFVYGAPSPGTVGLMPIGRGEWVDVAVEITWSTGADGRARVYFNDASKPTREAHGRNMYNPFQHYMKLGMYRHPDIPGDAWIYIRDIRIRTLVAAPPNAR